MLIQMKTNAGGRERGKRYKVSRWVGNNFVSRRLAWWVADTPGETPTDYPQHLRLPQEGTKEHVPQSNRMMNRRETR